jgi:hypothetical protein
MVNLESPHSVGEMTKEGEIENINFVGVTN